MVLYLSRRLLGNERLDNEFMRAYLLDDLAWQLSLRQDEAILGDLRAVLLELEQHHQAEIEQREIQMARPLVLFEQAAPASGEDTASGKGKKQREGAEWGGGDGTMQGLLAVLDTLRQEPTLVSVVLDFLRELGSGGG
jgi:hypothetical protein